ncbi:hypothetical protein OG241_48440 [Streptomyces sp. NBC_01390]|uniref:hypothetical protein n=1 Tax=Streptomyces sp. NBC_01390 TaxID=2903850 RepID=UPI0032440CBF
MASRWGSYARAGVETVLKGLQITHTLGAGLSLGAGDRALRLVAEFARRHRSSSLLSTTAASSSRR